jgi:hypothetical protein
MERDQVQDAINAAFADLPVPNPQTILRYGESRAEGFRGDLAGKKWQGFPMGFFGERWAYFCYLSPEAYRYYLPSLLTEALNVLPDESGLVSSVVYALCPSFWSLYYEGEDRDLREQQSVFTVPQYRAVCEFLGLVFDRTQWPCLRHSAAQALHWGWNQLDTPALRAANKYRHEMRSFSYTEPEAPEIAALCREISTAFAATPYPGDNALSGSDQGDEPADNAMELRGLKWQSAHPELLARCYSALSFLSDSGFRYFLPAFLLADLLGYETNADPAFHLTHGLYDESKDQMDFAKVRSLFDADGGASDILERVGFSSQEARELLRQSLEQQEQFDWRGISIRRFTPFDRDERLAIIHYLEFRAEDEHDATRISQALEGYWRPSVRSSSM